MREKLYMLIIIPSLIAALLRQKWTATSIFTLFQGVLTTLLIINYLRGKKKKRLGINA